VRKWVEIERKEEKSENVHFECKCESEEISKNVNQSKNLSQSKNTNKIMANIRVKV